MKKTALATIGMILAMATVAMADTPTVPMIPQPYMIEATASGIEVPVAPVAPLCPYGIENVTGMSNDGTRVLTAIRESGGTPQVGQCFCRITVG